MPVNVVMPQMGESVAEGTVVRWIKKVGDNVDRDEPLFEISTDKVDAEIPSPAAGTLSAIHVKEGETVPVDTVVALIAQGGEAVASAAAPAATASSSASAQVRRDESGVDIRRIRHRRRASAATPQADGSPTKAHRLHRLHRMRRTPRAHRVQAPLQAVDSTPRTLAPTATLPRIGSRRPRHAPR